MEIGIELVFGIVIGIVLGFCLSLLLKKRSDHGLKIKELEAEHEKYHKQVDDHFVNTAVLLNGLTDQYRDVYRHIASGAGALCSEEAKALHIDLEESTLLTKPGVKVEAVEQADSIKSETTFLNDDDVLDSSQRVAKGANNESSDEFPLATEVELSADIVEEIKSRSKKGES